MASLCMLSFNIYGDAASPAFHEMSQEDAEDPRGRAVLASAAHVLNLERHGEVE